MPGEYCVLRGVGSVVAELARESRWDEYIVDAVDEVVVRFSPGCAGLLNMFAVAMVANERARSRGRGEV
jgi:hypothetical protein